MGPCCNCLFASDMHAQAAAQQQGCTHSYTPLPLDDEQFALLHVRFSFPDLSS